MPPVFFERGSVKSQKKVEARRGARPRTRRGINGSKPFAARWQAREGGEAFALAVPIIERRFRENMTRLWRSDVWPYLHLWLNEQAIGIRYRSSVLAWESCEKHPEKESRPGREAGPHTRRGMDDARSIVYCSLAGKGRRGSLRACSS